MRVLVTGAAGRLGWHTVAGLCERGYDVVATDVEHRAGLPVKLKIADLLDRAAAYALVDGCDAVVHLGNHSNQHAVSPAQRLYVENVTMSMNIFQAAADTGVRGIVFASSIQAACSQRETRFPSPGKPPPSTLARLPFDTATPAAPGNHYALSKVAAEDMLALLCRQDPGLACASVRFPWLTFREDRRHRRRFGMEGWPIFLDEGLAYLFMEDAVSLIDHILRAGAPGHRAVMPSANDNHLNLRAADLLRLFFKGVPRCKPIDPDGRTVFDLAELGALYGWSPKETIVPYELHPEAAETLKKMIAEAWETP